MAQKMMGQGIGSMLSGGGSGNNSIISSNSSKETCGIANVLQFSIGQDRDGEEYQIWFTEWSENKIGKLEVEDDDKNLPFSITVFESDKELTTERGEREKIQVRVKAAESPSSSSRSNRRRACRPAQAATRRSSRPTRTTETATRRCRRCRARR